MNKKIVVFAPHPDDETLACGGTIAKKTSDGYELFIVILTDGRHAFSNILGINSDPNPEELKQIRKQEVMRATNRLGVPITNLLFLDFEDGTLKKHEKEAEERITEILRKHVPVEIYVPHHRDANLDHQTANRIVKRCLRNLGLTSVNYEYSTYSPARAHIGLLIERLVALFKNDLIEVDISEYLDLKQKAVKEFRSQRCLISSKQEKPILEEIDQFLSAKEIFHIVKNNARQPQIDAAQIS